LHNRADEAHLFSMAPALLRTGPGERRDQPMLATPTRAATTMIVAAMVIPRGAPQPRKRVSGCDVSKILNPRLKNHRWHGGWFCIIPLSIETISGARAT
jgi:hypothetical protein